jgi:rhodanese-related sulfurtransferase
VSFLLENWMLILIALTSGGLLLWPALAGAGAGRVSTAEAVRLINRERAVLIDIREPAEFAAGHAVGARNVPLASLDGAKGLPTNKTLPLLVLCATGTRATRAVAQLRTQGFQNVQSVAGGTAAWREANLPVEKAA